MNTYTIVKVLALCLGAVSVVTRTLPDQQSELNVRAPGGYGLSNNPTNQGSADAKIDFSEFNVATDVNDLKRRQGTGTVVNQVWDLRKVDTRHAFISDREKPERNPHDCDKLRDKLSTQGDFTAQPGGSFSSTYGQCSVNWHSTTPNYVSYNFGVLADLVDLLSFSSDSKDAQVWRGCVISNQEGQTAANITITRSPAF